MKLYNKIILSVLVIYGFQTSIVVYSASQLQQTMTIYLSYDGIEKPPDCLIPHKHLKRPKVGLALSGGGLRGIAQIGVLQVLEDSNIPIDLIVGSSMGSIIGGLYAAGYDPHQIWQIVNSIDWEDILSDAPPRSTQFLGEKQERGRHILQLRVTSFGVDIPQALTPGHRLTRILTDLTMKAPYRSTDFDKLRVPLRIITTDLLSGTKVVLKTGELAEAMRASIAIPLLFTPVQHDSMLLADGGILDNIPVEEAKRTGADIVIAVDTTSPLRTKSEMNAPWEVADQVTTIMQQNHNQTQRDMSNIVIDLSNFVCASTEIEKSAELFELGRTLTKEKVADIRKAIKNKKLYSQSDKIFTVADIEIHGTNDPLAHKIITDLHRSQITEAQIKITAESLYQIGSFTDVVAQISDSGNYTHVDFYVKENPVLSKINFSGNTVFSDSVLLSLFTDILGQPINHFRGKQCVHAVKQLYHTHGYSLMQIVEILFDKECQTALVRIDEGKIVAVRFEGLKRTRDYVVRREFPIVPGDIFNNSKLQQGIDNIYGTGLFHSVLWSNLKNDDGWEITTKLEEKVFSIMRFGWRYDMERLNRVFIELADKHIFGTGNVALLHAQYGNRDLKIEGSFRSDRLFRTYFTSNARLYHVQSKHYTYTDGKREGEYLRHSTGFTLSFGQQIERFGTLSAVVRTEQISLHSISGCGYPTGLLNLRTLGLTSIVDTRDSLPFPKTGKFHYFSYEVSSGRFLTSTISYFKVENRLESYYTLFGNHTFRPVFYWGTSDRTTPFSEQFRLGGLDSFFGLRDEELVGRHLILGSLEHCIKMGKLFHLDTYFSWRYDIGAVWLDNVDIKAKDFLHGIGCTFSFDTLLGPFSIAYGRSSDKRSKLYFSAGFKF